MILKFRSFIDIYIRIINYLVKYLQYITIIPYLSLLLFSKVAGTLSIKGILFGMITSIFVALNGVFTKRALSVVDSDSVKLTLYNNLNAIILMAPFVLATGQLSSVIRLRFSDLYPRLFFSNSMFV